MHWCPMERKKKAKHNQRNKALLIFFFLFKLPEFQTSSVAVSVELIPSVVDETGLRSF